MQRILLVLILLLSAFGINAQDVSVRFNISGLAKNADYGYTKNEPIKVGGGYKAGHHFSFIAHLRGPNGEELSITRLGSCGDYDGADQKYLNAMIQKGVLTCFEINCASFEEPKVLILDKFRDDDVYIPQGLTWDKDVDERAVLMKMKWGR